MQAGRLLLAAVFAVVLIPAIGNCDGGNRPGAGIQALSPRSAVAAEEPAGRAASTWRTGRSLLTCYSACPPVVRALRGGDADTGSPGVAQQPGQDGEETGGGGGGTGELAVLDALKVDRKKTYAEVRVEDW